MVAQPNVIHLPPDDDVVIALKRAAKDHQLVIVKSGEDVIEIGSISMHPVDDDNDLDVEDEPDAILELIGILDSAAPSNIAELKDQYLADAIDPRER